jgi:hypothetical protein
MNKKINVIKVINDQTKINRIRYNDEERDRKMRIRPSSKSKIGSTKNGYGLIDTGLA